MTDYDFFELGQPAASKTIEQQPSRQEKLPRIGKQNGKQDLNDLSRYEEDFDSFEESLKKSKYQKHLLRLLSKKGSKLGENAQNIKSANLKQTLAKGSTVDRQGRAFRKDLTRPANKSVALQPTTEQPPEQPVQLSNKGIGLQVIQQFPEINYDGLTDKQVIAQVERVRATIKRFNQDLNDIMERNHDYLYKKELMSRGSKATSLQDVLKTLQMMRETNAKTLQTYQNDLAKYQKRVAGIDGKDPVIKLTEEVSSTKKAIDECRKELKQMSVAVDKAQKNIQENVAAAEDDASNYRKFNELRNQLGYLAKKCQELDRKEKQVDKSIKEAQTRDDDINVKFETSKKLAEEKCLQVATNRNFVETKRKIQELTQAEEAAKRSIEVFRRRLKQMEENHDKDTAESQRESTKLDELLAIKQVEIGVVLKEIKSQVAKAAEVNERGLRAILMKFARTDDQETLLNQLRPLPPPVKKNYIDTSSTLKNLEADRTQDRKGDTRKQQQKRSANSPMAKPKDKEPAPEIFKPTINRRRDRSSNEISVEEAPKERQWKIEEKDKPKQTPPIGKDVDFVLNDKPEAAASIAKPDKMIFKFSKKKADESSDPYNLHNSSMPVISDHRKHEDKPQVQPQQPSTIQHKPKFFRPRGRESLAEPSEYQPTTIQEVVGGESGNTSKVQSIVKEVPLPAPEKSEQINSKPTMMRIQRRSQNNSVVEAPAENKPVVPPSQPVEKTEKDTKEPAPQSPPRPRLRPERPSKFKIEKQAPALPKQKYDIFAAEQAVLDEGPGKATEPARFNNHIEHNKELTLQELLGNDRADPSKEFDDLLAAKPATKSQKPKQRDFFGDMDL